MQLDLFSHSRDVMLRNDLIDALKSRRTGTEAPLQGVRARARTQFRGFLLVSCLGGDRLPRTVHCHSGRHKEIIEQRKRLRTLNPELFAFYMQTRD